MSDFATRLSSFSPVVQVSASCLQKTLALSSQIILTSLQSALNSLLQCLLRIIQLHLNLHDAVTVVRVLELLDVPSQVTLRLASRVLLQTRLVRPRSLRELADELVQDLAQQLMRDELVIVLVGDDDAGASLAARIHVDGELVFGLRLTGSGTGGLGDAAIDFAADLADAVVGRGVSGVGEGRWWC